MLFVIFHDIKYKQMMHLIFCSELQTMSFVLDIHIIIFQLPLILTAKIVSEYDQEIPQSQTADNPWHREEEPLNHHKTPGRQIKQSNQLSLPHQDDCNTRVDIK